MKQRLRMMALALGAILCIGLMGANAAYADTGKQACTDFKQRYIDMTDGTPGIMTNITNYIKSVMSTASFNLFDAFTSSSSYRDAVNAAVVLMVVLYGVGFLIGIVQANFGQVLTRLFKIGIIFLVISPSGWAYFNDYVVHFFNDGTDQIIGKVMSIGTGAPYGDPSDPSWTPFTQLDGLAKVVLSPDMVIGILGTTLNSGPYGLMMGGLLGAAMWGLIMLFIKGLKLYATSFVVRSLLFGVAPIFIVFILFERTKQLFSGWVNVMVFLTLQPILFFTFISFFLVMLSTATTNMMGGYELCWQEFKATGGTQNKISFWRFVKPDTGEVVTDQYDFNGSVSCYLNGGKEADGTPCKSFPINIVDILSFLILIYVAGKFGDVVNQIATEISNSFVNLDAGSKMALETSKYNAEGAKGKASEGGNPQASGATRPSSTSRPSSTPRK